MDFQKLEAFLKERKQPAYRLSQAKEVYAVQLGSSWEEVTSWPKELREQAKQEVPWDSLNQSMIQESAKGDTVKFLFECQDGSKIESVLMRHEHDGRETVCISCQVGCPMGCAFCATGTMGLIRNLTAEEIAEQVIHVGRWLKERAESEPEKEMDRIRATEKRMTNGKESHFVTNVVYMGMGEPMNNYDQVLQSVRFLNDPKGLAIGIRHISISTCGIVPGILKLAEEPLQVNLAISLHAATDDKRSKIMPVNRAYPVKKLMDAVDRYVEKTNRKVLFEYLMLDGVNDSRADAKALAALLQHKKHLYQVNVIKYHDTGLFKSTNETGRLRFVEWLREDGVLVTHRRTFGEDIDAACGQLAVAEGEGKVLVGKKAAEENRRKKAVL